MIIYTPFSVANINPLFNLKELFVSDPTIADTGGRRLGIDRRQFSYYFHVPERRSGEEGRSGFDRRGSHSNRGDLERRENFKV